MVPASELFLSLREVGGATAAETSNKVNTCRPEQSNPEARRGEANADHPPPLPEHSQAPSVPFPSLWQLLWLHRLKEWHQKENSQPQNERCDIWLEDRNHWKCLCHPYYLWERSKSTAILSEILVKTDHEKTSKILERQNKCTTHHITNLGVVGRLNDGLYMVFIFMT